MTDPEKTQQTLQHPLPDGVSDTFVRPCLECGITIHVVDGRERDHVHHTLETDESPAAFAWWQGHDAAIETVLDENVRLVERAQRAEAGLAEDAATITELRAEVERLTESEAGLSYRVRQLDSRWRHFRDLRRVALERAEAAEAETAALRARIEELAGELHKSPARRWLGEIIRAALAGAPAVTPTESTAPPGVYGPDRQCVCCWDGHDGDCRCVDCAAPPTETQAEDGAL